jgi:hypothetical protein
MNTVRVAVPKLVQTMKENRDAHQKQFEEAIEGWREDVVTALTENLEAAKAGGEELDQYLSVRLPKPHNYTEQYDRVIQMLEFGLAEEVELSSQEFSQYVMDNWAWKEQFTHSHQVYNKRAM